MSDSLVKSVALVTGANTGIGQVTAQRLAERGARVWLACRSREKTEPVLAAIRARGGQCEFVALDLADLASVKRCAEIVLERDERLDLLIANAGLAGSRGSTQQGFELTFGTNHLGHFLLTQLLLPRLRQSAPARVVIVSSQAHYDATAIDWSALCRPTRTITAVAEYQVSKLCNVLHAKQLAVREDPALVRACSLHPGVVASEVWRRVPQPLRWYMKRSMLTPEQGAQTTLYCATTPSLANGAYYDECQVKEPSPLALDAELGRELWRRSEAWVSAWV